MYTFVIAFFFALMTLSACESTESVDDSDEVLPAGLIVDCVSNGEYPQ